MNCPEWLGVEPVTQALPVLMYHAVSDHPTARCRPLAVRPRELANQLAYLRDNGFTALTASAAARLLRGERDATPERPVVLTFDDGYADFHTEALPLLERFGFTATLFVTTGWVADDPGTNRAPGGMLSWRQVTDAAGRGIEIGGHTVSHPQLDQLGEDRLRAEVTDSRAVLEDRLQQAVPSLAYPYGYSSAGVRAAVRAAGYTSAWAVSNALPQAGGDPFALPRLTVGWTTTLARFADVAHGRRVGRIYLRQRTLTKGKAVLRRSRAAVAAPARGRATR